MTRSGRVVIKVVMKVVMRDVMRGLMRVVVWGAIGCLAAPLQATVLVPAEMSELARDAGAIVRGQVREVESRWTGDRRAIETLVTIDAEASLKGSLGGTVRFVVPGGALGRYRSLFVGAPMFAAGQHVVVFLGWQGPSYPHLLGLSQGVFRVETDGNGGWLVTPPQVMPGSSGTTSVVRGDPARRPMPLAQFEQRVRALAVVAR